MYDELLEQERIKLALEAEARNTERRMHEINRVWHFNSPQLVSLEEAAGTAEANEEIAAWNEQWDSIEMQRRL